MTLAFQLPHSNETNYSKERVVKYDMFKSPSTRMTVDQTAQVNALEDKLDTTLLLNQKYQQVSSLCAILWHMNIHRSNNRRTTCLTNA